MKYLEIQQDTYINTASIVSVHFSQFEATRRASTTEGEQDVPAGSRKMVTIKMANGEKFETKEESVIDKLKAALAKTE